MAYDSKVVIKILGDATNFNNVINSTEASIKSLKGLLAKLGFATSVGAVTKEIVANTTALETQLANASTLFGDVSVNMDEFTSKIINLSKETGRSASSIASAVYQAESSGVAVTESMDTMMSFMESATKLSVAGFTSVENAVDSLAKIQNAYGKDVLSVDQISKNLVMTQNLGITTVEQLSQSLANVTPTASAFGVSLENIGASLSVMTKAGTDTARATTQLNSLISSLAKSDTDASKALKKATKEVLGQEKSFSDLIKEGKNLQEILGYMKTYADNAGISIVDLFAEMNAGKGALQLVSDSTGTFNEYLRQMTSEANIVQETYDKVMNTRAQSWNKLANRLKNITINVGMSAGSQALMDNVYNLAESIVDKFEEWTPAISRAITSLTVGGSILFSYIKENIESIPKWIALAFGANTLLSSLTSALGLSTLSKGGLGLAIGLEIIDGLNGTKTWEEVGAELLSALATGLTIGSFLGAQAGALTISVMLLFDYDLEDLGETLGNISREILSKIGTAFGELFDPKNEYSQAVEEGAQNFFDAIGIIADNCFKGIGTSLKKLFEGDVIGSIKSAFYQGMQMSAELMDLFNGGTENVDRFKVYKARHETPSANYFDNDSVLLKYINEAETQGVELEEYLQSIIAQIENFKAENLVVSVLEEDKSVIVETMQEAIEEGIELGSEEGLAWLEEELKKKIENNKSNMSLNVGIGAFTNPNSIDPSDLSKVKDAYQYTGEMSIEGLEKGLDLDDFYKAGQQAGSALEEGTREVLGIHSPSTVYEEIGEMVLAGLENGMTEGALEELKNRLDTVYTELGQDITKWLTEGVKDGKEYTITDAIKDFFEATKIYNTLGKQIEGIEIKETPSIPQHRTTGGGGVNYIEGWTLDENGKWVEKKTSWLEKVGNKIKEIWNSLGETIEGTEKTGFDFVDSLYEQFGSLSAYVSEIVSNNYDKQIKAMEEARDSAKKYNELSIEDEKAYDAKIKALKKEQFEKQKRASIATALIDSALAITNIWKEWSGNPIYAGILTALTTATLGVQIGAISSQQSGYERGGLIGGHGYTGDKQQIWANAGELILNRAQQRAIADQLTYGGNTTVIQIDFSGNVFGDQQTIAEYVYDAIKTAQSQGAIRAW